MNLSVRQSTKDGQFNHLEIFKGNELVWRCRSLECLMSNNPTAEFSEAEISALKNILSKPEVMQLPLFGACTFFEWGYINQLSRKGQRCKVFVPYGTKITQTENTISFEGVSVKLETKEIGFGDLRDAFSERHQPILKLSKGTDTLTVTDREIPRKFTVATTNGGAKRNWLYINW
jgi:hypothetical protein